MLTVTEEQIFNGPWYHDFSVLGCATPQHEGIFPPNQTAKQTPLFRFIEQALVMCRSANQTTRGIELFCADGFYGNYPLQRGADSIVAIDLDENELARARLITRLLGHDRMRIEREDDFNE